MYNFPDGLYCDVRIEDGFKTSLALTSGKIENISERESLGAFIRLYDGTRWYYSATSDVKAIQSEIDQLSGMADPRGLRTSDPVVSRLQANTGEHYRFTGGKSVRSRSLADKLAMVKSYQPLLDGREKVKVWTVRYVDESMTKHFYSSKGADLHWDYQRVGIRAGISLAEGERQFDDSIDFSGNDFSCLVDPAEAIEHMYATALRFLSEARSIEAGSYPVILSPEAAGVFAHESFGHKSEADFMLGDENMKAEWSIGKSVGSPILSIVDTGEELGAGFTPFDDEGSTSTKTYLIKNGKLSGRLHSSVTAASLHEELTGNGRAMNFEYEPIVRMTTTYIEPGDSSFDELLEGIEKGVFVETLRHGSGLSTFTLAPNRAWLIESGRITSPLNISVVSGSVFKTLGDIDGLSDGREILSFILGGCGKMEQFPLPVGFGGPSVRVKALDVQ